jgi:hypothetical protein
LAKLDGSPQVSRFVGPRSVKALKRVTVKATCQRPRTPILTFQRFNASTS